MAPDKKLELHIPSVPGYEKVAMDFAASVARMMGIGDDRVEDLKTAVAEACLNAIEHGNRLDATMKVGVTLTVDDSRLQVAVRDEGRGDAPASDRGAPSIEAKMEGRDTSRGWGIFLIESLMDEVKFESTPEGGNQVRMVIHVDRQPPAPPTPDSVK
jgi:serine/threonine-protein kinase RsbW